MTDNVERKPRASTCVGHLVLDIRTAYLPTTKLARNPTAITGIEIARKEGGKPSSLYVLSRHEPKVRF